MRTNAQLRALYDAAELGGVAVQTVTLDVLEFLRLLGDSERSEGALPVLGPEIAAPPWDSLPDWSTAQLAEFQARERSDAEAALDAFVALATSGLLAPMTPIPSFRSTWPREKRRVLFFVPRRHDPSRGASGWKQGFIDTDGVRHHWEELDGGDVFDLNEVTHWCELPGDPRAKRLHCGGCSMTVCECPQAKAGASLLRPAVVAHPPGPGPIPTGFMPRGGA